MLHLREVYSIPPEEERSWRLLLEEGVNQAVFSDTLEHLRKDSKEQERFYVDAVLDIFAEEEQAYNKEDRRVAKSYKQYVDLNRRANSDGRITQKIFFMSSDENYYCCRGNDLIKHLAAQVGDQYKISKKAVSAQLDYYGLLQRQGGELSYPIAKGNQKHRYYHLRKNVVEQLLKERYDEFQSEFDEMLFGNSG